MSECYIPEFYRVIEPTAKKPHACCECSAPILKGEKYVYVSAKWEGQFSVEKQHLLCANACRLVRDEGFNADECLYFGQLFEWWNECGVELRRETSQVPELRTMIFGILRRTVNHRRAVVANKN